MDKISPKLVKISDQMLSQPLADAINNSISNGVFPDNAKIKIKGCNRKLSRDPLTLNVPIPDKVKK